MVEAQTAAGTNGLVSGFYKNKCVTGVDVEAIVRNSITASYNSNKKIAPGILRMFFHDAFVHGADASVLINATGSERSATPNQSLHGFEAIDAAKSAVESSCPGVVSCADILAFAARDVVALALGVRTDIRSGRRDGLVSSSSDVVLPGPNFVVANLTKAFIDKGLTQRDMVVLSGGHTIGVSHCRVINNRLYNPAPTDPPLDATYAATLKAKCPKDTTDTTIEVNMDPQTPDTFDNKYYGDLLANKGLFISDQILFVDNSTKPLVQTFASGTSWLNTEFPASFRKMSEIEVKTGTQGEIRKVCWKFNSS